MVIAAYDDSGFARSATTQRDRSLGAYAGQIDGGMPGSRESPVIAIGLFEQQRGLCMSLTRRCCKQAYHEQNKWFKIVCWHAALGWSFYLTQARISCSGSSR